MRVPALLACLLAAFATAALAHALIALLGSLGVVADADAYAGHSHGSVGPVALGAAALLGGLLLRAALRGAATPNERDPVVTLAAALARADVRLPVLAVALGGFTTLMAMEFAEQFAAFGRADCADALGGNPLLGLCAVALVALVVTVVGARCARNLVAAAIAASRALVALFVTTLRTADGAIGGRRFTATVPTSAGVLLARRRPSRAPPVRH